MQVDRRGGAVAGVVAAGAALATGEFVTAVDSSGNGLVSAVGDEFVDRFAGALKDVAIALFGTNDKAALVVGIVVVSLALGAFLGTRTPGVAAAGFAGFAVLGAWAYTRAPAASDAVGVLAAALAAGAGIAVLAVLRRLGAADRSGAEPPPGPGEPAPPPDPRVTLATRRQFLAAGGAAAAASGGVAAAAGRLRAGATAAVLPPLPTPTHAVSIPPSAELGIDGLNPFVTPTEAFFRIDTALVIPRVDAATWSVEITGRVDRPFTLTYDELLSMESIEAPVTLQCVSNQIGDTLVGNARWQGVDLRVLLERAGVLADADQVVGRSVDGFTAGFPTAVLDDDRTALLVYAMNGEPLTPTHGFPARLVVAGLYGYVSATKWLSAIELTRRDEFDGFWIPRGWAKDGPIKVMSRIDVPRRGQRLTAGPTVVAGVAWAPARGIDAVRVRIDGEERDAALAGVPTDETWVQWSLPWEATPGEHELSVHAVTADGEVQTAERRPPAPDGATGHHTVRVVVG